MPDWSRLASCWVKVASSGQDGPLGGVDGDREEPEPLDLHQGRRAVRHVQHAFHDLPGPTPGSVRKLWHALTG
jgi:hypothetical protein